MEEPVFMLTTTDNPWNPFTQYDEWDTWDRSNGWHIEGNRTVPGYYTSAYLARVANTSGEISPAQYTRAINDAIFEIVSFNLTGNYVAVTEDDYKNWIVKPAPVA